MTDVTRTMAWALLKIHALEDALGEQVERMTSADRAEMDNAHALLDGVGIIRNPSGDTLAEQIHRLVVLRNTDRANAEAIALDLAEARARWGQANDAHTLEEHERDTLRAELERCRGVFDRVCEGLADLVPGGVRVSNPEEAITAVRAEVERLHGQLDAARESADDWQTYARREVAARELVEKELTTLRTEKPEPRTLSVGLRERVRADIIAAENWKDAEEAMVLMEQALTGRLPEGA